MDSGLKGAYKKGWQGENISPDAVMTTTDGTDGKMARLQARRRQRLAVTLLAGLLAGSVAATAGERPKTVAVFDFELIDTSLEGEVRGVNPAEQKRLRLISDLLRRKLADSGDYVLVDTAPAAAAVEAAGHLYGCNGWEADIARSLGADLAFTGTVQKVSNLILNINLYVRDAATEKRIMAFSVDIRGNTDTSWSRGISYIVKNRLLPR